MTTSSRRSVASLALGLALLVGCGGASGTSSSTAGASNSGGQTAASSSATAGGTSVGATSVGSVSASGTTSGVHSTTGVSTAAASGASATSTSGTSSTAGATSASGAITSGASTSSGAANGTAAGSTGSSGGSTGGLPPNYAGGCTPDDYYATEWRTCGASGTTVCGCGQVCTSIHDNQTNMEVSYCLTPCDASIECPDTVTVCSAGTCINNYCATPYTACGDASYCLPFEGSNLCVVTGALSVGDDCSPDPFSLPTSSNCASGLTCDLTSQTCVVTCDAQTPPLGPTCPNGTHCVVGSNPFQYGDVCE